MPQIYELFLTVPTTDYEQLQQYRDDDIDDEGEVYSDSYHSYMDECSQQLIRTSGYVDSDREVDALGSGRYHHADLIRKLAVVQ